MDLSSKSSSISKQLQPMIMMVLKGYPTLIRKATSLKRVVIMRVNKDLRVERGLRQSSISYLTGTRKLAVILTLTSTTCRITRIAALIQRAKWVKDHLVREIFRWAGQSMKINTLTHHLETSQRAPARFQSSNQRLPYIALDRRVPQVTNKIYNGRPLQVRFHSRLCHN